MGKYKDGRKLASFRLSLEDMRKLNELARHKECSKANIIRTEIGRAYARLERRKGNNIE